MNIASYIDHTLLKPEAMPEDIEKLCREAIANQFAAVCVNPCYVGLAAKVLDGFLVKVCTVVGFPLGASTTQVKLFEADRAIKDGAREVDMVINVGRLKGGDVGYVRYEIAVLAALAHRSGILLKVIVETCLLTDEEKRTACRLAKEAGADFVKTSTGFGKSGATLADVTLMRAEVGPGVGVKAAGGISDRQTAMAMLAAGATRIGTSKGVEIVQGPTQSHTAK